MAAAKTIPIIFSLAGDPVKQGIVSGLNRPGGNVPGVTFTTAPLGAKRLESVRDLSSPKPASQCLLTSKQTFERIMSVPSHGLGLCLGIMRSQSPYASGAFPSQLERLVWQWP